MTSPNTASTSDREFVRSRLFDAPRELVFEAYSKAEHLAHWWGPTGWTLPVCNIDFREGGVWHYCMRGPNGEEAWGKATYREIVAPERIVYLDTFSDAEGNVDESLPQMVVTIEFADEGGKTRLTDRAEFASAEALRAVIDMGMEEGAAQTWDRLDEYLASLRG